MFLVNLFVRIKDELKDIGQLATLLTMFALDDNEPDPRLKDIYDEILEMTTRKEELVSLQMYLINNVYVPVFFRRVEYEDLSKW